MRRIKELIQMIEEICPDDGFFDSLDEIFRLSKQAKASYRAYDKALNCMDHISWERLSQKAISHFKNHRNGQRKQGFFNQLNEAFAYQFLQRQGYTHVTILPEDGQTTPDLSYCHGTTLKYCEVKSIGVSQEEINRWETEECFDKRAYYDLSTGFMDKLDATLAKASRQIASKGHDGIIFVIINFDDFTLSHYKRYRRQISQHLYKSEVPEVYVKIGLMGGKKIHKRAKDSDIQPNKYRGTQMPI